MNLYESLAILGVDVNADESEIKKIYAEKVKNCHPEEQPEKWARLHKAYKTALAAVSSKSGNNNDSGMTDYKSNSDYYSKTVFDDEEQSYEGLFEEIDQLAEQKREQLTDELKKLLDDMESIKKVIKREQWMTLFSSESFLELRTEDWVVELVTKIITKKRCYFSSVKLIYETLMEWQDELQTAENQNSLMLVKQALQRLNFRWNLTERTIKRMGKVKKRSLWTLWKDFWGMPLWLRALILLVVCSWVVILDSEGVLIYSAYLFIEWAYYISRRDYWFPRKRQK